MSPVMILALRGISEFGATTTVEDPSVAGKHSWVDSPVGAGAEITMTRLAVTHDRMRCPLSQSGITDGLVRTLDAANDLNLRILGAILF
jgi:hypothetical protein